MEETKKEFDESIVEETASEEVVTETEEKEEVKEETNQKAEKKSKKDKKKSVKVLELELEKSAEKVAELTDRYQRLMAEFENARKRTEKEKKQNYDIGAKEVLSQLLPVVDNFERGLDAIPEEEKEGAFAQGFMKIYQQMMDAFTAIGVTPMDAAGKEFNPDFHNAVMHIEDEELGENVVAEEFQKGYMYKDMVLRHSMVKVAN